MEGVTLIESGTSRTHFAFLKRIESAKSDAQADGIILSTIAEIQVALSSSKSPSSLLIQSSISSTLLTLLHCVELFPISFDVRYVRPSIQFALIPCLQLAATASKPKDILLAYTVLGRVFQAQDEDERQQTSLLVLNTVRQHLEIASPDKSVQRKDKGRTQRQNSPRPDPLGFSKVSFALKMIISGVPSGPDIFPALYGPISLLCHHPEVIIQSLALDALAKIQIYVEHDESIAKAMWERTRNIMSGYQKKRVVGENEALPRALLRAIQRTLNEQVIDADGACDAALSLLRPDATPGISIACLEFCKDLITNAKVKDEYLEKIGNVAAEVCLSHAGSYSTLLSGTEILGVLAHFTSPAKVEVKRVWDLIKSHLNAKNANRKLLVLACLEAFLPFSWHVVGNQARIGLEEDEMNSLMGMLGDRDDSVRIKALRLFHEIDITLLEAHYKQLLAVSKDDSRDVGERKELMRRAIEVAGEQYINSRTQEAERLSEMYITAIMELLSSPIDEAIDDGAIRIVISHLRRAPTSFSSGAFLLLLLKMQQESDRAPSPTMVLLVASLTCELDIDEDSCKISLTRMASLLPRLDNEVALSEALLIGLIKTSFNIRDPSYGVDALISKIRENNKSSLVQHRLSQLSQILENTPSDYCIPGGTLLATMDRIESYFATNKISSSDMPSSHTASTPRAVRPLKYDAYQEGSPSSSSLTSDQSFTKSKKPFSALPRPSAVQDKRTRRQQKLQEDGIRAEMQKSIARLTLGEDESDDDEQDMYREGKESRGENPQEAVLL